MTVICDNCKTHRLVTDFINNQKYCYQCEYRIKLSKMPTKRTPRPKHCRMCGKAITHLENIKKRQRNVFCSCECAKKGHKELINNHWTKQIRSNFTIKDSEFKASKKKGVFLGGVFVEEEYSHG